MYPGEACLLCRDKSSNYAKFIVNLDTDENVEFSNPFFDSFGAMNLPYFKANSDGIKSPNVINLMQLFPKGWDSSFVWYKGSFTNPPCDYTTIYTYVFIQPILLNDKYLRKLRRRAVDLDVNPSGNRRK